MEKLKSLNDAMEIDAKAFHILHELRADGVYNPINRQSQTQSKTPSKDNASSHGPSSSSVRSYSSTGYG